MLLLAASTASADVRCVSTERANVREGPGLQHTVLWEAYRFTPLEVVDYEGEWLRVRDVVGDEGWAHQTVLTCSNGVAVAGKYANIRQGPGLQQPVMWTLDRGYPLQVIGRDGEWLQVSDGDVIEGWILGSLVWGLKDDSGAGA